MGVIQVPGTRTLTAGRPVFGLAVKLNRLAGALLMQSNI